jgi:hypothetical protein
LNENKLLIDFRKENEEGILSGKIREEFSLEPYLKDENICIICYANFKQIIFSKCGHKCICYICFEKIDKNNNGNHNVNKLTENVYKCPMCQQESNQYVNSFHLDFEINSEYKD